MAVKPSWAAGLKGYFDRNGPFLINFCWLEADIS